MMLKVFKEQCLNCLFSKDRIVSPSRAKDLLKGCEEENTHFICHEASVNGENVCCKVFYEKFGHLSNYVKLAERLNLVEMVEQKSVRLPSYSEMKNIYDE